LCTPIGHTLAGATLIINQSVFTKIKPIFGILILIVVANLPDIDYLFGFFKGNPNLYHHGWTHSFVFVLVMGFVVYGICYFFIRDSALAVGLIVAGILFTHLILDYFTLDTSPPFGLQLFWPFSTSYFISSATLFGDVHKSATSVTFIQSLFVWHNLKTVLLEIVILVPVLIVFRLIRKRRNRIT